ncbi:MAG: hypothetical protein Q9212_001592 [Teloschistes hypoglaucus]
MATQNALLVETVGKPIVLGQRPIPTPGDGEILIKVTVVGLNPYEHRVRDWGLYVDGRLPVVIGNDIAGIIEKFGPDTESYNLKEGDHIFGQTNYLKGTSDQAGLQQYCLLDAYTVAKVPSSLTDDDGTSLICNVIAPFWAIFGADGLALPFPFPGDTSSFDYSKETIVIIGAGSNCGKYAVQSCALAGFGRIIVTASKGKNEGELKGYGAAHIIDRHDSDQEAQIRALVGDDLIYAFDAVNLDHTLGLSILSNTKKGTLACIVPGKANSPDKIGKKAAGYEEKFVQGQSHNQPELGRKFWNALPGWMESKRMRATAWEVLEGLDAGKVNAVLDTYRDGGVPPKQVHVHV